MILKQRDFLKPKGCLTGANLTCPYRQNFRTLRTIPNSVRRLFARLSGRPSGRPTGSSPARPSVHPSNRLLACPAVRPSSRPATCPPGRLLVLTPPPHLGPALPPFGRPSYAPSIWVPAAPTVPYNQVLGDRPLGPEKVNYRHKCLLDCRCRHHVTKRGVSIYTGGPPCSSLLTSPSPSALMTTEDATDSSLASSPAVHH